MSKKYRCISNQSGGLHYIPGHIYTLNANGSMMGERGYAFEKHEYNSAVEWLEKMNWYKFEEVKDMFTKSDLCNGDIVVTRNSRRYVYIKDYAGSGDDVFAALYTRGREFLSFYDDELRNENNDSWDIMKVYRCDNPRYFCQWNTLDSYRLLYDRNKAEERKKLTVEEVEELLGYKVAIVDKEGK